MLDGSPSVLTISGVSNMTAKIVLPRAVDELVGTTAGKPVGDDVGLTQAPRFDRLSSRRRSRLASTAASETVTIQVLYYSHLD
jgi:hypothetical protein